MRAILGIMLASLSITLGSVNSAAEEGEKNDWSAHVEVLMVTMPPSAALALQPKLQSGRGKQAAFEEVQRMIEKGEANVLGWPIVTARNGMRVVSETVEEVRYPTEFDPPMVPSRFVRVPESERYNLRSLSSALRQGVITPTHFETRNTGQVLEVQAVVKEEGKRIALSISAGDLRFVKYHQFAGVKALNGGQGKLVQPEFVSSRFTGQLSARSGEWMLLSRFVEQKPTHQVILFLLRAIAVPGATQDPTR